MRNQVNDRFWPEADLAECADVLAHVLIRLAPRPGLEPGTCGLTERRSLRLFAKFHQAVSSARLGLFFSRSAEIRSSTGPFRRSK